MVYLTLSTGVGGGVVVDGRLFRGSKGNGGELGHITVDWRGRPCRGCGRRGCLEAYASGTSIGERAREAGLPFGTAEQVAAAARAGDAGASAVWDETVEALACGLTSIVNVFEPELVVLGGGVTRSGEQLLGPTRARVQEQATSPAGRSVRARAGGAPRSRRSRRRRCGRVRVLLGLPRRGGRAAGASAGEGAEPGGRTTTNGS